MSAAVHAAALSALRQLLDAMDDGSDEPVLVEARRVLAESTRPGAALSPTSRRALQYVKNTNGCATQVVFQDDHSPSGPMLWDELFEIGGYITVNHGGRIFLTTKGEAAIAPPEAPK